MKKLRVLLAIVAMLTLTLWVAVVVVVVMQSRSLYFRLPIFMTMPVDMVLQHHISLVTGNDTVLGGYARLAAYITGVKNEKGANNVLLCDSGDFTMGTVIP